MPGNYLQQRRAQLTARLIIWAFWLSTGYLLVFPTGNHALLYLFRLPARTKDYRHSLPTAGT